MYSIKDKYISKSWLDGIHPKLQQYLNTSDIHDYPLIKQAPDIYSSPIFTDEWCKRLNKELHHYDQWLLSTHQRQEPPNSMHEYGVNLSELGFDTTIMEFSKKVIFPLVASLYPEVHSDRLSDFHAFSVQYGAHGDNDLGFHVDASEVTVNICIGESWHGGDLYFQGRRCEIHRQEPHRLEEHFEYRHSVGEMIIHAGKHRHGVHSIESGFRRNLILWYSAKSYTEEDNCPSWCQHKP